MADTIIQTRKTKARKPGVSFALSLFFPGLGQMYNGDLAGGAAFGLLRVIALMAPPAWAVTRRPFSSIDVFIAFMLIILALTIASPLEALIRARRNAELPVRAYNSTGPYVAFTIAGTIINVIAVMILASFFSIRTSDGDRAGPLLDAGDVLLIQQYAPEGYRRGELALLEDGSPARIIAREGDSVKYEKNIFYINGRSLPLGYLADGIIARFAADREDVVSESGDAGPYPVRFRQSPSITLQSIGGMVQKGAVLAAADTRLEKDFARVVPAASLRGRVEGILFSLNVRKIGMNASGDLR
jgi:hypothetical protein